MTIHATEITTTAYPELKEQSTENIGNTTGQHTLTQAAHPLLVWIAQIDQLTPPQNVEVLKQQLTKTIQAFEHQAKLGGTPAVTVLTARYLLCTFVDEMILQQNWPFQTVWSQQSMLSTFHQETWGGERFFELLAHLQQDPQSNIELLILIYLCLSLGFQGKFRLDKTGQQQLENTRMQLYQLIKAHTDSVPALLLHRYQPIALSRKRWLAPKWVVAITCTLLLLIFAGFKLTLYQQTQPVVNQLNNIMQPFVKGAVPYENF